MSEKEIEYDPCKLGYREFLSIRMKKTWEEIKRREDRGETIMFEDFGQILHEESDKLREEMKKCKIKR